MEETLEPDQADGPQGETQDSGSSFGDVEIGIGTWAWGDRLYWGFGKGYDEKGLRDAFHWLIRSGVNFFDTAEVYGQGNSEEMLGRFTAEVEQPVRIATKFMPLPWRLSRKALLRALRKSLKSSGRGER